MSTNIADHDPDVVTWLAFGERGMSSEAIVNYLTGVPVDVRMGRRPRDVPIDSDDFKRCRLVLEWCPSLARPFVERMGACSQQWMRLVEHWDDLCEQMDYASPNWRDEYANGKRGVWCKVTSALIDAALGFTRPGVGKVTLQAVTP